MTPSLADEINRKALDTLAQLLTDRENGVLSPGQVRAGLVVLFNAVSGLTGSEVFQMISEASESLRHDVTAVEVWRELYADDEGNLVQLEYIYGGATVTVRTRLAGEKKKGWSKESVMSFDDELVPFEAAKKRMDDYAQSLLRRGYAKLS